MEDRSPFFLWFQVNEIFGVEKAGGVRAVVGAADLAGALGNLWKRAKHNAGLIGNPDAFVGAGAGGESAAHPESAFIEMGQEFRADNAAEGEKISQQNHKQADTDGDVAMANGPSNGKAVSLNQKVQDGVAPFFGAFGEGETAKDGGDHNGEQQGAQQGECYRPGHGMEQPSFYAL
jgi:hypothetical protein